MDQPAGQGAASALLEASGTGDMQAREQLLPMIYDEMRSLAASYLRQERAGHTLQPTALVHEAYLRMIDQRQVDWSNRAQFVGLAAVTMASASPRPSLPITSVRRKSARAAGTAGATTR